MGRSNVALVLVSAAVGFLNVLNYVAALTLIHGTEFLAAFETPQRYALGMLFLRLHGQGEMMNEIFWVRPSPLVCSSFAPVFCRAFWVSGERSPASSGWPSA